MNTEYVEIRLEDINDNTAMELIKKILVGKISATSMSFLDASTVETYKKDVVDALLNEGVIEAIKSSFAGFHVEVQHIEDDIDEQISSLRELSELDIECLMDLTEFIGNVTCGGICDYDGHGYYATLTGRSQISCWDDAPSWATHVCWYNK
jgi:hypothetical protein